MHWNFYEAKGDTTCNYGLGANGDDNQWLYVRLPQRLGLCHWLVHVYHRLLLWWSQRLHSYIDRLQMRADYANNIWYHGHFCLCYKCRQQSKENAIWGNCFNVNFGTPGSICYVMMIDHMDIPSHLSNFVILLGLKLYINLNKSLNLEKIKK